MSRKRKKKRVYLDYASITPMAPEVRREMQRFSRAEYMNPSSIHAEGYLAKRALDEARARAARFFGGRADEIIFTGGGTEANNLAVFGVVESLLENGEKPEELHIITTEIEHASVLEPIKELERRGVRADYVCIDERGITRLDELKKKLRPETCLVSVMYVNNEIGAVQPIPKIARIIRDFRKAAGSKAARPLLHTDASQAPMFFSLNRDKLGFDLATIDGQKIYGPRGVGALYKRRGVNLKPIVFGGGQEKGARSGTENLASIRGLAKTLEICERRREKDSEKILKLRDYLISEVQKNIPQAALNGDRKMRSPNNVNFSFPGVDGEFLVLKLDSLGFAVSAKSSCLRDEPESYVVRALGGGQARARASVRISLGRETGKAKLEKFVRVLQGLIQNSP